MTSRGLGPTLNSLLLPSPDPLMASALDSATCSNPWSAFGDDQAGEVLRLRADELFPDAVAHIVRGAEEHSGTSFDKVESRPGLSAASALSQSAPTEVESVL